MLERGKQWYSQIPYIFTPLSFQKNDELGLVWLNSIDSVRQKLGEDNVHKKKEKKRKWVSPNWAKEDMNDEKTASNNTAVHIIKKILN